MRQKPIELQGENNESTMIAGDLHAPLSEMVRSDRQKISKDIADVNTTINQLDITDIFSCFIQQQQNIHSSQAHIKYSPR